MGNDPLADSAESELSLLRRRLAYLAARRSMLEMEAILGRYLETRLWGLGREECLGLIALLSHADLDLWDWLNGVPPPGGVEGRWLSEMTEAMRAWSRVMAIEGVGGSVGGVGDSSI